MSGSASPRNHRVLKAAGVFWLANGYAPTMRELVELTDYLSTSAVTYAFRKLTRLGLVEWDAETARSLRLTAAGWKLTGLTPPCANTSHRGALVRISAYCHERAEAGARGDWDGLADLADTALEGRQDVHDDGVDKEAEKV